MHSRIPVIGAAVHYARAELVTVAMESGAPALLDRRRVALIEEGLPVAPYHHEALELELGEAAELVERVRRSVAHCAKRALSEMKAAFRPRGLVLPASPYDLLPESLEEVLASRPLTNAADGMLYREALAVAGVDLGLDIRRVPRKADSLALAAESMGCDRAEIVALLAQLGREFGPPWQKDHKEAAAVALWVLGRRAR